MPLVVVLPLVTGMSVVPPSQIVSSVAVMVTVGSTHTSTVIGMPGHLLLPLVTGMSVVPPSQIVSSVALIVTVGSTHTSTVIGVPGHLLLPFSSIVHGVMV